MSLFNFFIKMFLFIVATIFATVLTISLPVILFPLWSFFQLYKSIVVLIAKFRYPKATLLSPMSRVFAIGDTNKLNHFYVSICIIFEGKFTMENLKKIWNEKIIKKTYPDGKLVFPEFQQYIRKFCGYSFWEFDKSYSIEDQINAYQSNDPNEVIDKEKLTAIRKDFHEKVFPRHKPIWSVLIVNNYRDEYYSKGDNSKEYTAVIFKVHHALGDGFSVAKLLWCHLCGMDLDKMKTGPRNASKSGKFTQIFKTLWHSTRMTFLILAYLYKYLFNAIYSRKRLFDRHPWHLPVKKNIRDHQLCVLNPINKRLIKNIKESHKVSIMCVNMALVLGGIKRMMTAKNLNLPHKVRVTFPVPKPNHPDHLANHAGAVELMAPFSVEDPIEGLRKTNTKINESLRGPTAYFVEICIQLLAAFPYCIIRKLADDQLISVFFSAVPFPSDPVHLCGCQMVGTNYFITGTQSNGVLVGVSGLSDAFHITVQIEKFFLNYPAEVKLIEKYILEELDSLTKTIV